jgi:hypothetical protein
MTPLDKTKTVRFLGRSGRREVWHAVSADRHWTYSREEMPGTPWLVTRRGEWGEQWFGTLMAARRWTAGFDAKASRAILPANPTGARVFVKRYDTTTERWYILPGQRPADHAWHSRRPGHLELSVHIVNYVTLSGLLTELPMADLRKAG